MNLLGVYVRRTQAPFRMQGVCTFYPTPESSLGLSRSVPNPIFPLCLSDLSHSKWVFLVLELRVKGFHGLSLASVTRPNVSEAQLGRVCRSPFPFVLSSSLTWTPRFSRCASSAATPAPAPRPCWQPSVEPPVLFLCVSILPVPVRKHGGCMCASRAFAGRFPAVWPVAHSVWAPSCGVASAFAQPPVLFVLLPCASWPNRPASQRGCWVGSGCSTGQWSIPRQSPSAGGPRSRRFCQQTG